MVPARRVAPPHLAVRLLLVLVLWGLGAGSAEAQRGGGIQPMCQSPCGPPPYAVVVTPDGGTLAWTMANAANQSAYYMMYNTGTTADTYALACSATSNLTCGTVSPASASLAPGDSVSVRVRFSTGGGTGYATLTLTVEGRATDTGTYQVEVVDPPIVTLAAPGAGTRLLVHNRQPVIRALFLPRSSAIDTTTTVLTFRGDTVSTLARHGRGLLEWEVDSTRWRG